MRKYLSLALFLIIHIACFSQTSKLWITVKANAGTSDQSNNDLVINNGSKILNLSSSTITCTSSSSGSTQTYSVTLQDDYDKNGVTDKVSFDLVVKAYKNSTLIYSVTEKASSMTALGPASNVSTATNVWGVNNTDNISDLDEGETLVFTVENLTVSNLAAKYKLEFDGFNLLGLYETNGGNTHKIIKGHGTGLTSYSINASANVSIEVEKIITLTGAGSVTTAGTREWGLSSIGFSISIVDTESGGFNDLSDYSLFSNADNFGKTYPAQTKVSHQSDFCWDKVPRWLAVRNTQPMTDAEITDLASHYQIILLEKANNQGLASVDEGMVSFATRLKAKNSKITTLFYWNSWIHYGGYTADANYNIKAWSDLDANGNPVLFKDLYETYNYDVEALRNWWIQTPLDAMNNDVIDGVFIDKVVYGAYKDIYPNGEPVNNYVKMLTDLYNAVPNDKILIGNIIRTERVNSNRGLMEVADGSYMERWAMPGSALDEAEGTAISIQAMREALAKGKEVHFQTSPHDTGGDAEPADYAGKVQYAKDNVNYPLAVFLIFAEKGAYFSYQVSVNALASAAEAWNTSFVDEFSYRLGAPLGPPIKDGYIYERSYENVDVWVDLTTKKAVLNWHDKTSVTTTACTTSTCIKTTALVEAECFDEMAGVKTEVCTDIASGTAQAAGENVGYIQNGDWMLYKNLNLTGMKSVLARISGKTTGSTIEVRLGSTTGKLIATVPVTNTGGNQVWKTDTVNLNAIVTGTQNVYLVFKGGSGYLYNLNWFGFSSQSQSQTTLKVNSLETEELFTIYTNPATSLLNIKLSGYNTAQINIINTIGQTLISNTCNNGTSIIDISRLPIGIYVAKAVNNDQVLTKKFIKK